MSQTIKCDRCGAESTDRLSMSRLNFYLRDSKTLDFDLCSKCINELAYMIKDWVEKRKNETLQK